MTEHPQPHNASSPPVLQGPHAHPIRSRRRELIIALGLALGPAVALGLARFAYALLLPTMRAALGWSYLTAGTMNTANALGYLLGALVAAPLSRRWGTRPVFLRAIAITGLALLASAATGNVPVLLMLRILAGTAGAACFITGAALTARLGQQQPHARAAQLLGVYFAGGGLGITVSGLALAPLLAAAPAASSWRWGWAVLASATLLPASSAARATPEPNTSPRREPWPVSRLAPLLTAYALFGAGYIAYMTFIVAFLDGGGATPAEVTAFWAVLGLAAIGGGFLWSPLLGRWRGGRGPATLMLIVTAGALVPLLSASTMARFGSAALFGVSFLAVVTAVTVVARASLQPHQWSAAIAALTIAFSIGQCLGPILAGVLSDRADGVHSGLLLSVAILAAGAIIAMFQPIRAPGTNVESPRTSSN